MFVVTTVTSLGSLKLKLSTLSCALNICTNYVQINCGTQVCQRAFACFLSTVNSDDSTKWLWFWENSWNGWQRQTLVHHNETLLQQTDRQTDRQTTCSGMYCMVAGPKLTNLFLVTCHNRDHRRNDHRCHHHAHILQQSKQTLCGYSSTHRKNLAFANRLTLTHKQ